LLELKQELNSTNFSYEVCDLADAKQIDKTFHKVLETHGAIDCLINNAGMGYFENVVDETPDQIIETFQTNLIAPILCSKKVIPDMMMRKAGVIINIGSTRSTAFRT
jgi:short-subunit dehydrogenase